MKYAMWAFFGLVVMFLAVHIAIWASKGFHVYGM